MSQRSIHHRRRWFYLLWVALLGAALGAYALWSLPVKRGVAHITLTVGFKEGAQGGMAALASAPEFGVPSTWKAMSLREGVFVGELEVPLAFRRWVSVPFEGRCHERLVVRYEGPEGTRYFTKELKEDLFSGLLRPGRRVAYYVRGLDPTRLPKDIRGSSRLP